MSQNDHSHVCTQDCTCDFRLLSQAFKAIVQAGVHAHEELCSVHQLSSVQRMGDVVAALLTSLRVELSHVLTFWVSLIVS